MCDESIFNSIKALFLESLKTEIKYVNDFINHVMDNDFFGINNKEITSLAFIIRLFEKRIGVLNYIKELENSSSEIQKGTLLLEYIKNK